MPLKQLSDEQIRSWSRLEKDRWWLANVFRGDLPQLTFRSALTGFILGGILSATALYIGAKTASSPAAGSFRISRSLRITAPSRSPPPPAT